MPSLKAFFLNTHAIRGEVGGIQRRLFQQWELTYGMSLPLRLVWHLCYILFGAGQMFLLTSI